MSTTRTGTCRSCGAPILWMVIRPSGRTMPLDAEPADDGTILVDADRGYGIVVPVASLPGRPLYRSHFATCPQAGEWRKK